MSRFEGKTALVTGGARGIGAATAERLASEGAHVVVADFDEAAATQTAERIGGRAARCDVTSRADVEAAVAVAAESGRLDILVTSAGIIRDNLLHKMTDDDWEAVIATHLRGSFLAAQAAQARMPQGAVAALLRSSASPLSCPATWPAADPRHCSGGSGQTSFFGAGMVNAANAVAH